MKIDFEAIKREDCREIALRLGLELNRQDKARCFLHAGDKNPSLMVYADGWKCFGCGEHGDAVDLVARYRGVSNGEAAQWIIDTMGTPQPTPPTPKKSSGADYGKFEREHIYPGGQLKHVVYRKPDGKKDAPWRHLESGKWVGGRPKELFPVPPLYRRRDDLPASLFLTEGEKDVDRLERNHLAAVSLPDGSGSDWYPEYQPYFSGRSVYIIQDNDAPGKKYAQRMAATLQGIAKSVYVLDLTQVWPEIPEHSDVSDLLDHLGDEAGKTEVLRLARNAKEWVSPPSEDPANNQEKHTLDTISAVDLQKKDLPPIKFAVNGLLPVGLNILASPPKYGKSWMVLALCLAVASGGRFLGYMTNQCGCLYLALEDSQRRLKTRMNKLLAGKPAPPGFHFATMASPIDNGLFDELEDFLKKHPDTGLIVIDTLQRVRGASHGKEGAYAADYREVGALKAFADQHNVVLTLVHHLRKMKDDGDPFNMISGTNGIMGAADTTMVLTKEKREDKNATLSVVGRDVESSDTVLQFNRETCYWENLGDADWFAEQQALQEYQESPIVKTVKKLLEQSPDGWEGTAQQLLDAGRFIAHTSLANSTRSLSSKLKGMSKLLFDNDGIVYERKSNGSGGGKQRFFYVGTPQFEELEQTETNPFLGG